MTSAVETADASIAERVRAEVQRTIQRSIKGLNYFLSDEPALGLTPNDTIYRRGTLALNHYRPLAKEVYRIPVLLVMSLVSKSYILDLAPGQSFIEFLLKQGYDVYLIDWGVPRPEDSRLKLGRLRSGFHSRLHLTDHRRQRRARPIDYRILHGWNACIDIRSATSARCHSRILSASRHRSTSRA